MVDPITGALIGTAVSTGVSALASRFFGGQSRRDIGALRNFRAPGFQGGGIAASRLPGGGFDLRPTQERLAARAGLATLAREQGRELRALREQVRPGFGRLTEARVAGNLNARRRAIGNLRENLALRRVLGSSFAADAQSRAEAEFGQRESEIRAQSFLDELNLTNQLVNQEFEARRQEFTAVLDDLNITSKLGQALATGAAATEGTAARQLALLAAQDLEGIGRASEPFGEALGQFAGDLFGGRNRTTGARTPRVSSFLQRLPSTTGAPMVDAAGRLIGGI